MKIVEIKDSKNSVIKEEDLMEITSTTNYQVAEHSNFNNIKKLVIILTDNCKLRCSYCYEHKKFTGLNDISKNNLVKYIKENIINLEYIQFFGGEPLMYANYIDQIATEITTFNKNIEYSIVTNGVFLNKNNIEILNKHSINTTTSIDGYKKLHDTNRVFSNGKGSFDIIQNNIKKIT